MRCAVAILARAPELGRVKTRLARDVGPACALVIYRTLLRRTLEAAAASKLPVTLFLDGDPDAELSALCQRHDIRLLPQCGESLAQRMQYALRTLQRDYPAVLLMGSDCLVLDGAKLVAAARQLHSVQVVVYPAEDGGFVLYGERADAGLEAPFMTARLGTGHALRDTVEHLHQQRALVTMLDVLWDVDTVSDARRAARLGLLDEVGLTDNPTE